MHRIFLNTDSTYVDFESYILSLIILWITLSSLHWKKTLIHKKKWIWNKIILSWPDKLWVVWKKLVAPELNYGCHNKILDGLYICQLPNIMHILCQLISHMQTGPIAPHDVNKNAADKTFKQSWSFYKTGFQTVFAISQGIFSSFLAMIEHFQQLAPSSSELKKTWTPLSERKGVLTPWPGKSW